MQINLPNLVFTLKFIKNKFTFTLSSKNFTASMFPPLTSFTRGSCHKVLNTNRLCFLSFHLVCLFPYLLVYIYYLNNYSFFYNISANSGYFFLLSCFLQSTFYVF